MSEEIKIRKKEFKDILEIFKKNKYLAILIAILLFSIVLRLKYFNINSAVWWDEAEYLVKAKEWALGTPAPTAYWSARPIFMMLLWVPFLKIGASEAFIRFLFEFVPSVLTVLVVYLLGKEMYNKKIGLISAFIMSVFWLHLFMTARLLMDLPGLLFSLLTVYFFWKGFVKKQSPKNIWLTFIFLIAATLTKFTNGILIILFLLFLLITQGLNFLKNKKMWISAIILFIIGIIPYIIFNKIQFGSFLPAIQTYILSDVTSAIHQFDKPAYYILGFFQTYLGLILFIFFILGLLTLYPIFIGFDLILKQKEKKLNADLFIFLLILMNLIFFIFIYKTAEPRYLLIISPFVFFLTAKGILLISKILEKVNKYVAIAAILIILGFGAYSEITIAHASIISKKDTYLQVKIAGEWIKENTDPEEILLSNANQMELRYASEREIDGFSTIARFEEKMGWYNSRYVIISMLGGNGVKEWIPEYFSNTEKFTPVYAVFMDEAQTQPAVVIYQVL